MINQCVIDMYRQAASFEEFSAVLISLNGEFTFDGETMYSLLDEYIVRCPDNEHHRNLDEVHLGYALVRICITEKVLASFESEKKRLYREILFEHRNAEHNVRTLASLYSAADVTRDYTIIQAGLNDYMALIDKFPRGMVKERSVGGITALFNMNYMICLYAGKC
jgi:hypothetical protein